MRGIIDRGMRGGIPEKGVRDRVFTIYASREEFNKLMGLSGTTSVHVLVADRSGAILASVTGGWTPEKEEALRKALSK
jgi:hypothetical protein